MGTCLFDVNAFCNIDDNGCGLLGSSAVLFFCFGLFEFRLLRKINVRAVENVDCLSISL